MRWYALLSARLLALLPALLLAHVLLWPQNAMAEKNQRLLESNAKAGDILAEQLEKTLNSADGIVVMDFSNLADPRHPAVADRLIPSQIASRLAQRGFRPVSREAAPGADPAGVMGAAMLTGEYTAARDVLYVQARIVRLRDSSVLAGADYEVPATPNVRALTPGSWGGNGKLEPSVRTSLPEQPVAQSSATQLYTPKRGAR